MTKVCECRKGSDIQQRQAALVPTPFTLHAPSYLLINIHQKPGAPVVRPHGAAVVEDDGDGLAALEALGQALGQRRLAWCGVLL